MSGSWQFQKQGDSLWFPAQVPGTVQTDLFANNQIPDPYYSDNEAENKWIENENWVYRKHFNWSKSNNQHADLVFEGLDTYATVYLNDHRLFSSDNMFRSYKLNIDSLHDIQTRVGKKENGYRIISYTLI